MKSIRCALGMFALGLIAGVPVACAQEVSAYLGLGSAHDSRNGLQINTFGDGTLYRAPTLGGLFADLGASVFFNRKIGAGAEIAWRPSQGDYAGIKYRPSIYSFDGIFRPLTGRAQRFEPEFRAGIGGARVRYFFDDPSSCDQVPGCPDASHFQVHLAVATRIYLADHFFLRPAFDLHYVNHLSEFGSNWAPRYSFGLGYSLGRE